MVEVGVDVVIFDILKILKEDFEYLLVFYGVMVWVYEVDVMFVESFKEVFVVVVIDFNGKFDILVVCVGVNKNVYFFDIEEFDFVRFFDVNCKGVYFLVKLVV